MTPNSGDEWRWITYSLLTSIRDTSSIPSRVTPNVKGDFRWVTTAFISSIPVPFQYQVL